VKLYIVAPDVKLVFGFGMHPVLSLTLVWVNLHGVLYITV